MCISLSACGIEPQKASFSDAETAFNAHNYTDARIHLMNLLRQNKNDLNVQRLYAKTLLQLGDGIAARRAIETLQNADGTKIAYIAMMGHADILRGQAVQALKRIENVPVEEWDADMFCIAIWAHQENGTLNDNLDLITRAQQRHGDNADVQGRIARAAVFLGDWQMASQAVQKALERDPDNYEALLVKAEGEIRAGALDAAKNSYAILAQNYAGRPVPLANIAGLEIDMGNLDAAQKVLADAVPRYPNYAFLQFQNARLAFARGDARMAYDILEAMPQYVHDFPSALSLNAEAALALNNVEVAIARLERLQSLDPENEKVRAALTQLR